MRACTRSSSAAQQFQTDNIKLQTQNIGTEGWSKTRTPLPPPPRRVREESRYSAADRPKRIFVAVAAGVGLLYLLMMLWAVQTLRTLQTVQGRVVGAWITHGKGTRYMLGFEYAADGRLWSAEDGVDKATYDRFVGPSGKVVPGFIQVHVSHGARGRVRSVSWATRDVR